MKTEIGFEDERSDDVVARRIAERLSIVRDTEGRGIQIVDRIAGSSDTAVGRRPIGPRLTRSLTCCCAAGGVADVERQAGGHGVDHD